jgi:hypothetical protein
MDGGNTHAANSPLFGSCLHLIKFLLVFFSESYPLGGSGRASPQSGLTVGELQRGRYEQDWRYQISPRWGQIGAEGMLACEWHDFAMVDELNEHIDVLRQGFVEFDELPEVADGVLDFPAVFRRFRGQVIAGVQ